MKGTLYDAVYKSALEYEKAHKRLGFADGYMIGALNMLLMKENDPECFRQTVRDAIIETELLEKYGKKSDKEL